MEKINKIDKGTIIRTAILVLALVNQVLVAFGKSAIPVEDANVDLLISTVWTIAAAIWSWWKNNNITKEAIAAQVYLDALKNKSDIVE